MQTNELTSDRLRHLADLRPDGACVLSLFLNLDPSQFGTAPARATEANALVDEAERRLREANGLSHDQKQGLRRDIEAAHDYFRGPAFNATGAHQLALFPCSPDDFFETLNLPR